MLGSTEVHVNHRLRRNTARPGIGMVAHSLPEPSKHPGLPLDRSEANVPQPSREACMAVPVLQVTASVIIALFLLQLVRRAAAQSQNGLAQSVSGGLDFLLAS